ncbi:MAG: multidrug effflux MFS transporter [Owenweeksia sp.]|nr:multidrug effflux MFS transporter [Owenweeksia sp.]
MTKKQQNSLILLLGALAALGPPSIWHLFAGFPAIAEDLQTKIANVSLTLTSYFIGISVGQLIYGPMLDRYGRKKPLLFGLALYMLAAIGCALAPSVEVLIGLRLLQALGGCVGMVASRAIIRDRFEAQEIARVFSSLILVMGVAPIVAPTVGGYISESFGWRYIFVMLAAFSAILLLLIFRYLSESKIPDREVSLCPLSIARNYWAVLENPELLIYTTAGSLAMAGLFVYIAGSPFVFMELMNFDEKSYGWIFGLNALGLISGSQLNRALLRKRNSESVTNLASLLLLVAGTGAFLGSWLGISFYCALLLTALRFYVFSRFCKSHIPPQWPWSHL